MNLKNLQADPAIFQRDLYIPTGLGTRKLGDVMEDFQRERFTAINPSLLAVSRQECPPISRIWDERTKGGSKDTDWAVNLLWPMAFSRRPLRIQVGAYDQQQADELRLIVKGILRIEKPLNKFLSQIIEVQQTRIVNKRTASSIEILTTDKLGSHGARPDVVLINELTHHSDRAFAETLLDNLDKVPSGLGIIATNAGFMPSWPLEWKNTFTNTSRWLILEFKDTAGWIGKEGLKEAEQRNSPGRFKRLWKGIWSSDTEGALDSTDIDACITELGPMSGKENGWIFYAGLDIGLRKHATAFLIVGRNIGYSEDIPGPELQLSTTTRALIDLGIMEQPEPVEPEYIYHDPTHRLRLADIKIWKPKPGKRVSLEAVKTYIMMAHKKFNLAGVAYDPYQGEHLAELLERAGVPVVRTPQTTLSLQEQATSLVEAFQQRSIDLFDDADLLADLKRLQVKDSGLKIRLVSPEQKSSDGMGTSHGDAASGLSYAISLAKNNLHLAFAAMHNGDKILAY